jgi:hypothetical protein
MPWYLIIQNKVARVIMLNDVMGNCNIIVENIQKTFAQNTHNKKAVFFLLAATIAMIMTVTPILLIQEAKAFNTQKCFDHPKQCKWTSNHCLKKEPNVCDDGKIS